MRIKSLLSLTFAVALAVALVPWAFQLCQEVPRISWHGYGSHGAPVRGAAVVATDVDRGTGLERTTNDAGPITCCGCQLAATRSR